MPITSNGQRYLSSMKPALRNGCPKSFRSIRGPALLCLWLSLVLILPLTAFGVQGDSVEEKIFKANQAYKEDRFTDAVALYRELTTEENENGELYYNLGNAYLRSNQLGRAILSYQRARLLMPRDADLKFNLRYALDQTRDEVPGNRDLFTQAFFWLDAFNLKELYWGAAAFNLVFWGLLFIRLFTKAEWTYYTFLVILFLTLLASGSFGIKWYELKTDRRAVILAEEVNVLAGPDVKDTILFKLHAGAQVNYERDDDGWALIGLSDSKRGWIEKGNIERVVRPR